jgi:hypothetical protein
MCVGAPGGMVPATRKRFCPIRVRPPAPHEPAGCENARTPLQTVSARLAQRLRSEGPSHFPLRPRALCSYWRWWGHPCAHLRRLCDRPRRNRMLADPRDGFAFSEREPRIDDVGREIVTMTMTPPRSALHRPQPCGGGRLQQRPRRVRNSKTRHWLSNPVSATECPEKWTKGRGQGWLGPASRAVGNPELRSASAFWLDDVEGASSAFAADRS